jgi:hypothetical protein
MIKGKDLEGSGRILVEVLAYKYWKERETSVSIAGIPAKIRTKYLRIEVYIVTGTLT